MNAQLLTILSNAGPAKSGIGALLSKATDAKNGSVGASFADLLGQQTDGIDSELLDMLAALGIDPQAQKELLMQLKEFGVDSDQLNKLLQQFKNTDDPKQLLSLLRQSQSAPTDAFLATNKNNTEAKSSADFINSTLFIAHESKAIRTGQAALASLQQDASQSSRFSLDKDSSKNSNRFDVRFDLENHSITAKKAVSTLNTNNTPSAANNTPSAFNAVADIAKTAAPSLTGASSSASTTLLTELSGLSAQSTAAA